MDLKCYGSPSERLAELGISLPDPAQPSFEYVPAVRDGDTIYVAGQLPKEDGAVRITGRCGEDVSIQAARRATEICTMQGIACAAAVTGGIDGIERVLRVTGFVASTQDFHDQPKVLDAASQLLSKIFNRDGQHARSAIGVASLPRRAPVEIEFIFKARRSASSDAEKAS